MPVMEETYYTVKEIADKYKVSQETIRRYIRQRKLEAVEFENTYRISEAAWLNFLNRKKTK